MLRPSEKLEIIKKLKNLGYDGYYGDIIAQIENTNKEEPRQYDLGGTLNTGIPTTPAPLSASVPTVSEVASTYQKTPFQKKIDLAAKNKNLNENQLKALYVLNGVESKSGIATEDAHYSRDGMYKTFGGTSRSGTSLSEFAKSKGWYKNGKIVGESTTWTNPKTGKTHTVSKKLDDWIISHVSAKGKDNDGKKLTSDEKLKRGKELFNVIYSDKYGRHLDNDDPNDGWKYRGRGGVQLTGKANYKKITDILNKNGIDIDLVKNPELAADPKYSADVLLAFAEKEGMFNPNSKKYLTPEDYELIAKGDVDAIDKLHNITNVNAPNERMIEEASKVFGFKSPTRSKKKQKAQKPQQEFTVGEDTMQRMPGGATPPMSLEDFEKTTIKNYRDEVYQEREKAYGGLIKTRAPQRYVGKAYQDRKHHAGFMEGDLNMYSMAKGGPLKLSPEGGPKAEEINNDYNADGMMKARLAYEEMHGNPAAKRMVSPTDNPYMFPSGERGTHYMGSYGNYAVPNIQDVNGRLEMTGPIANEEMRFETEEDARYFAKNYKNIAPAFQKAYGGPLSGSNSGKPKKDISSVGQRATDYFMSNAYLNASGDNVPYNSDMGEIIDLNLPQPEENNPIRFNPYISGSEKGLNISGNLSMDLGENLRLQGGAEKYYDFSPEAEESKPRYNFGLKYRIPYKRK